jgi:hypothetical protein
MTPVRSTGAERQPERHFYREYAETDSTTRYSRRGGSAGGRGNGGVDFDYDVFADLFRGRGQGGKFRMPPQGLVESAAERAGVRGAVRQIVAQIELTTVGSHHLTGRQRPRTMTI